MKLFKLAIVALSSITLLSLIACNNSSEASKTSATNSNPTEATFITTEKSDSKAQETHKEGDGHDHKEGDGHDHSGDGHGKGGQVVETGDYHLEFLTHKADNGVSLDFVIEKGEAHTPITTAKVTAQVQLPDGTQQALDMKYDAGEKVYKAVLAKAPTGEYNVAVLSEVDGKKMNSRFSFKQ